MIALEERFATKFRRDESSGCWVWTAALDNHGYGRIYVNEVHRPVKAYRVSYELHRGPIPDGLQIDHLCRNRACVNPEHLEAVSQAENIARGESRATLIARTGTCIRGHDGLLRTVNGRYTRCSECRKEQRRGR